MQTVPNDTKRRLRRLIAGLLALVAATVLAGWLAVVAVTTVDAARAGVPVTPSAALTAALAAVGAAGLAWLVLGVVLEVLARVPGIVGRTAARASAALSPLVVRRVAALVIGAGIGSGAVGAAHATPQHVVMSSVVAGDAAPGATADLPDPSWAPAPDPGWTPEPPLVRPQPDVRVLTGASRTDERTADVVVHRGDSLWTIAARHLGEGATDAEVAAEWPRWYAANRDVVGPDPDVLHPGQVLRSPAAADASAEVGS